MATLKQNSEALRAITDKLKSLPKRHVLTEVTLTPSKDDVVAVPNDGEAFSKVTVNGDTNLVAENIAEGVSIFGVTGTHAGGGGDMDALIDGSITEVNSGATSVRNYAFYYSTITSASFPNATSVGEYAFRSCTALISASFPNATSVGAYSFQDCSNLISVNFPNATQINGYTFSGCSALTSVEFPKVTKINSSSFQKCYVLKSLILRSETVCNLTNANAFTKCYHILGTVNSTYNPNGDKDGYIYVPSHLVESYKTKTNWSTYASQIRAIDEGGGEAEGNWLFQNEQISGYTVTGLPAPVNGVSYTCFVDGEEISTSTCEDGQLRFSTEDYRVYLIYDPSAGDTDWHFHPMDSQVKSGIVSIRIND